MSSDDKRDDGIKGGYCENKGNPALIQNQVVGVSPLIATTFHGQTSTN